MIMMDSTLKCECNRSSRATKRWRQLFAAGVVLLSGVTAQGASVLSGIQNEFGTTPTDVSYQGESRFSTFSDGGDGTLDVGDKIRGQLIVRTINQTSAGASVKLGGVDVQPATNINELTGFIELEVRDKTGNATDGFTYKFGAWTSGTPTILFDAGNPNAIIALYEDSAQNGNVASLPIPDPSLVDGELYGYLGLGTPGTREFTVTTGPGSTGLNSSAANVPMSQLLASGNVSLNLVDQDGLAITDASRGDYNFNRNPMGTQFAGSFNFFGGAGTGADFTAQFDLTTNIGMGQVQIIPLPPALLAALPGLMMVLYSRSRRTCN